MLDPDLADAAAAVADRLRLHGHTVAVAEGSCGGLISTALLSMAGASAYYRGGAVIYTPAATRAFIAGAVPAPPALRGASEPFARYLARAVRIKLDTTWGIGEGGATGPQGNPYGDPPGHAWVAVAGPEGVEQARHVLTGSADRAQNMVAFATTALALLEAVITPG